MAGDLCMVAPRRLLSQKMKEYEEQVFAYRWDVAALNDSSTIGVAHFAEVMPSIHPLLLVFPAV